MSGESIPLISLKSNSTNVSLSERVPLLRTPEKRTRNKLETLNGCFVPCCLTIMSAVLFLRLGWATGEAGILQTIGMLVIGEAMTTLTALSLSAIVTNGDMRGGGSYYMISRSLGPEYGGAIGTCFFLAYSVGVSFHAISMGTEIQETWLAGDDANPKWTIIWISSVLLFTILLVSLAGAHVFTRFNVILFIMEMGVILLGIISFLVPHNYNIQVDEDFVIGRVEFPKHFVDNLMSNYSSNFVAGQKDNPCHGDCSFQKVFSIIFPMVTGIMEGANLSGDLRNPAKSIPVGTLSAILVSGTVYLVIILIQGASFSRYWLVNDLSSFQNATLLSRYIVVIGILIASYSSALGAIFGGSRLLQAISRDNLFPFLKIFSYGSIKGDEPRIAVILTWLIAQCCLMAGSLDIIAPVITSFFCLAYGLVNFTCLLLSVTGVPNFRPRFKYFSAWTAFIGFCINIGVMFFLNWIYALIGMCALFCIFIYLSVWGPTKDWGEISQAIMFHQVRKYLLRLNPISTHNKFWRPNILLLTDNPNGALIGFCGCLKWGGILVVGQGIIGDLSVIVNISKPLRQAWINFNKTFAIKAFPQIGFGSDFRSSAISLMQGAGIGGLTCNTVCFPILKLDDSGSVYQPIIKHNRDGYLHSLITALSLNFSESDSTFITDDYSNLPVQDALEYCQLLQDSLRLERNVVVAANYSRGLHQSTRFGKATNYVGIVSPKKYTDIWLVGDLKTSDTGSVPALWGYSSSLFKVHSSVFSLQQFIDGGNDNDAEALNGLQGLVALLLQLGSIADGSRIHPADGQKRPKMGKLRLMHVPATPTRSVDADNERKALTSFLLELCNKARLDVDAESIQILLHDDIRDHSVTFQQLRQDAGSLVALQSITLFQRAVVVSELVNAHSVNSCQVVMPLPFPNVEDAEQAVDYVRMLNTLTRGAPPTILVCNGEEGAFISTCI